MKAFALKPKLATFVTSAANSSGFPPPGPSEIAFAGRSNVGKSSLINALVGVSGLAKTSRTPGRTRLINWFSVHPQRGNPVAFVDLPGYGYANVPTEMRKSWRPLVESYLLRGEIIRVVIVLIDIRRGVQSDEIELVDWLVDRDIRTHIVLTKADKLPKSKRMLEAKKARGALSLPRTPLVVSAAEAIGISELRRIVFSSASKSTAQK